MYSEFALKEDKMPEEEDPTIPEPTVLPPGEAPPRNSLLARKATRRRVALLLALLADALQLAVLPLFVEGAASPADDLLDLAMAAVLSWLLGWHWEFLPSFAGKLIPGVDLAPLWTLAVLSANRKAKRAEKQAEGER